MQRYVLIAGAVAVFAVLGYVAMKARDGTKPGPAQAPAAADPPASSGAVAPPVTPDPVEPPPASDDGGGPVPAAEAVDATLVRARDEVRRAARDCRVSGAFTSMVTVVVGGGVARFEAPTPAGPTSKRDVDFDCLARALDAVEWGVYAPDGRYPALLELSADDVR